MTKAPISVLVVFGAISVSTMTSAAIADDVNRTGQTQTNDSGKPSAPPSGGDANTMGGGNDSAARPSEQPQQSPGAHAQSPGEAKTNAESGAPQTKH